jgi:NhaP-type Na+/H+ or K+/H+ antiporter
MSDIASGFAVIAAVLTVTALASGLVERSPLSFPFAFIALGLVLGGGGFGAIELGPHDEILEIVATFTLSLVLFLDAVKLQLKELGSRWPVPLLVLGPGTGLIIALGAGAIALLFDFSWTVALIGGAVLASTDPVVLRELVRDDRVPRSVRQALQFEAGLNDIVVLPVILVLIEVAKAEVGGIGDWSVFLAQLMLLGPAIGMAVGGVAHGSSPGPTPGSASGASTRPFTASESSLAHTRPRPRWEATGSSAPSSRGSR